MRGLANKPEGRRRPGDQWFHPGAWRNSYWFTTVIAFCIGLLIVAGSPLLDRVVHHVDRSVYASDWLAGILAMLLSGVALLRIQMRRRELLTRMQIIEDVNHHVRNALTTITLSAALREDKELNALVKDASARIDWVLTEVLSDKPSGAGFTRLPSRWLAGRQLGLLRRREHHPH